MNLSTLHRLFHSKEKIYCPNLRYPQEEQEKALKEMSSLNGEVFFQTSGTTKAPSIIAFDKEQLQNSAASVASFFSLTPKDRWLLSLPLYHVGGFGIALRCWHAGATPIEAPFSLEVLLEEKITHLSLVPTQLFRLLKSPPEALLLLAKQLKTVLIGGSPISPSLFYEAKEKGLPCLMSYGLTEAGSTVLIGDKPDILSHLLPHLSLHLDEGEIVLSGASIALNKGPFYKTKDLAILLPNEGYKILGRKDLQFISGGENIQPEEIEAAIYSLFSIETALIAPSPDPEFGFRPIAFVSEPIDLQLLRKILPGYKIPLAAYPLSQAPLSLLRRIKNRGKPCEKKAPSL